LYKFFHILFNSTFISTTISRHLAIPADYKNITFGKLPDERLLQQDHFFGDVYFIS